MNKFELAKKIRKIIINKTAEVIDYTHWDYVFATKYLRELPNKIKKEKWFKIIDPTSFNENELIELGFFKLSENRKQYLIPLWLFPFIPDKLFCWKLGSGYNEYLKSNMDTDTMNGCIAYGVRPIELPNIANEKEQRKVKEVPCPNCYGGHFRPCQLCGDTGVALKVIGLKSIFN